MKIYIRNVHTEFYMSFASGPQRKVYSSCGNVQIPLIIRDFINVFAFP